MGQGDQLTRHQITGLLIVGHQATYPVSVVLAAATDKGLLLLGQGTVQGKQPGIAVFEQTQQCRPQEQFIGENQIIGVLTCKNLLGIAQHPFRIALAVQHLQLDAQVSSGILHVAAVIAPETLIGVARVEKTMVGTRGCADANAQQNNSPRPSIHLLTSPLLDNRGAV